MEPTRRWKAIGYLQWMGFEMPAGRLLQTNFNGGEQSSRARGRSDLAGYFQSAEILENLFCLVEGPASRRPGFEYVADVKFNDKSTRLVGFTRSTEKSVLIEIGDLYMRFFDGDTMAPLEAQTGVTDLVTTFTESQVHKLYHSQSADVMWFCSLESDVDVQALKRFADDDWQIDIYKSLNGPFLQESFGSVTITPNNEAGSSVFLNASSGIFSVEQIGGLYRILTTGGGKPFIKWKAEEGKGGDPDDPVIPQGDLREHDGKVYLAATGGVASNQPPVHDSGIVPDGGGQVQWNYLHDFGGSIRLHTFNTSIQVIGSVEERLPSVLPTNVWAQGAFSIENGYPKIVGIFEQRLFFCSTKLQPDTIFLGRIAGFNAIDADFKPGAGNGEINDDDAITLTLADNEINSPSWALSDEQLILGTPRGLIRITGPSPDEGISPSGALARRVQGSKPASRICRGILADGAVVYASIGGAKLYEMDQGGRHTTLTAHAQHVGASEIIKIIWLGEPYQRLFALRADGGIFCLTYDREQQVRGWARIIIAGSYLGGPANIDSMDVIRDAKGNDRLVVCVLRSINGATRRTTERLALDWRLEENLADEAVYMDAAVTVDLWNKNTGFTISLAAASGAGGGDTVTLTAVGHTPFTGTEGQILSLRNVSAPIEAGGARIVRMCQIRIDTLTSSAIAVGTFIIGPDEDGFLVGPSLDQWAWTQTQISGLAHLEGESVVVQADGMDFGSFTVTGGVVDIAEPFSRASAGLEVNWRGRSLPMALRFADGASKGQRLTANKAYISMLETGAEQASVRVIEDGRKLEASVLGGRRDDENMGDAPAIGNFQQEVHLSKTTARDLQLEVFGGGVLPATLESIALEYSAE
jgi:hypothetical protein